MKKLLLLIYVGCLGLLCAACQSSPEVINSNDSLVVESLPALDEKTPTNVLLMQVDSNGFPQSQGVYDFSQGTLTVVKQYVPSTDEVEPETVYHDFENTFLHSEWENDPYEVYEETFKQVELSVNEQRLRLRHGEFEKSFYFEQDDKTCVRDENNVIYTVQYDM